MVHNKLEIKPRSVGSTKLRVFYILKGMLNWKYCGFSTVPVGVAIGEGVFISVLLVAGGVSATVLYVKKVMHIIYSKGYSICSLCMPMCNCCPEKVGHCYVKCTSQNAHSTQNSLV